MIDTESDEPIQRETIDRSMQRVIGSNVYFVKNGKIKKATLSSATEKDNRQKSLTENHNVRSNRTGTASED